MALACVCVGLLGGPAATAQPASTATGQPSATASTGPALPPMPDCHAPDLDAEKLYRAALAIAETNPLNIAKSHIEKLIGIKLVEIKSLGWKTIYGQHIEYGCSLRAKNINLLLSTLKKNPTEKGNYNKEFAGAFYMGLGPNSPASTALCIERRRVEIDEARHGWEAPPVYNDPAFALPPPDLTASIVLAKNHLYKFTFDNNNCLSAVYI